MSVSPEAAALAAAINDTPQRTLLALIAQHGYGAVANMLASEAEKSAQHRSVGGATGAVKMRHFAATMRLAELIANSD